MTKHSLNLILLQKNEEYEICKYVKVEKIYNSDRKGKETIIITRVKHYTNQRKKKNLTGRKGRKTKFAIYS